MQSKPSKSLSDLSLKALILSGGVAHPYAQTSQQLKQILEPAGIQSLITENLDILASPKLENFDIVVLNCLLKLSKTIRRRVSEPGVFYESIRT